MSQKSLKKYTTQAMKLEDGPIPEAVFLPPALRGKMVTAQYVINDAKPITIEEHVIRINQETDPVGLLIAIANGQPIPTITIDEHGEQHIKYETLPLKDRVPVIKFLSDKVLPRMSVFKKLETKQGEDPDWIAKLSNAGDQDE